MFYSHRNAPPEPFLKVCSPNSFADGAERFLLPSGEKDRHDRRASPEKNARCAGRAYRTTSRLGQRASATTSRRERIAGALGERALRGCGCCVSHVTCVPARRGLARDSRPCGTCARRTVQQQRPNTLASSSIDQDERERSAGCRRRRYRTPSVTTAADEPQHRIPRHGQGGLGER